MKPGKTLKIETLLTEHDRKQIYTKLALAFCIGGALFFLSSFLPIHDRSGVIMDSLTRSVLICSFGVSIFFIQKIKKIVKRQILISAIFVISIPLVTFQVTESSSHNIWVFSVLIIFASLVFAKRTLLIAATITAILTQCVLWMYLPENTVVINAYDYILRILFFLYMLLFGFYINRMYVAKIKDNNEQIVYQKLVSQLSLDFVNLDKNSLDNKINNLLKELGIFFEVDRTYLFLIDHDQQTMTYTHEWCNTGIQPEIGTIANIPLGVFPWWIGQLQEHKIVHVADVNQMPPEADEEQRQLIRQNIKSLVSLPVEGVDKIHGFIGIDSVQDFKNWSDEHLEMLNILAYLIAQGLNQRESDEKVKFMAYYDYLTKLPNRILFTDRLTQALHAAERNKTFVCTMFIDLDNFKSINDTFGHSVGDELLKIVAQRLLAQVRKTDTVCRFGGDEFLIMLNNIQNIDDVHQKAENMVNLFTQPYNVHNCELFITTSAGIAISAIDGDNAKTLIKNADLAMYKAKEKGKNTYVICTSAMKEQVEKAATLSNSLNRALERDEFTIYYQPQIDLYTGEIDGVEALLRWNHKEYGLIPPDVFIPLAEKGNLINTIGEWVLQTACSQNKKWQDMGFVPMTMAVNLSSVQLTSSKIVNTVKETLEDTHLHPDYLELEITESTAIQDSDDVFTLLTQLKELGIIVAIDDFGTEYSSLTRLKSLPIDRIKIDIQFIRNLEKSEKDRAIILMIITLARSLGLNVIAEGVETLPQLEFLQQNMCDHVQGYYYYKPMPAEEIEKILKKNSLTARQEMTA